ncbi:MAG: Ig-like domain-containing protein [Kofleriaceae bacterium]
MGKLVALICAFVIAACGDGWHPSAAEDQANGSDGGPCTSTITSLDVWLSTASIDTMQTAQAVAMGTNPTGVRCDASSRVVWTSSDARIATIEHGAVIPHRGGTVMVTASYHELSDSELLQVVDGTVTITKLSVAGDAATLPVGQELQFHATADFSDGTQRDVTNDAAWSIDPDSVAAIDATGNVTGMHLGNATVTAQWMTATGSAPLSMTAAQVMRIEVDGFSLAAGYTKLATATAVYSDGSTLDVSAVAQWSSTPANVATVGAIGLVTAHAPGSADLAATVGSVTGHGSVTVTAATLTTLEVSPATVNLGVGAEIQLGAIGVFSDGSRVEMTNQVAWSIAGIGNAVITMGGRVSSPSAGIATATATFGTVSASAVVVVTAAQLSQIQVPAAVTIPQGRWLDLSPIGVYSDGTTSALANASFSSSNTAVATVSGTGRITAIGAGTADITVTSGAISAVVHVVITAVTVQTILISPIAVVTTVGAVTQMSASATYSDGTVVDVTAQGAWDVGNATVATVSNAAATRGQLTGVTAGITTVTFELDTVTASAAVIVSAATLDDLIVTPPALVLPAGMDGAVVALGHYSDGSSVDVTSQATWSSSDSTIATVSNAQGTFGHVVAKAAGTATITVTKGAITKTVSVTVTAAVLDHIELPTTPLVVPQGMTLPVIATGVYSDGSRIDITSSVGWSSSAPAIASVSNLALTIGVVRGNSVGSATLTASSNGHTATVPVTVTSAILQSIVMPSSLTVPKGLTLPLVATGMYSDGSSVDITNAVTWASSAPAIASVSNLAGHLGLVTGNAVGDATVTATYGGQTVTTQVHVTAALLQSLSFASSTMTLPRGLTAPIVATGVYSDGSVADLTKSVTWTSSAPAIATVSSVIANAGLVTGVAQGTATITASLSGKTATTTVTVTSAILSSIQLPSQLTVPKGLSVPVIATGVYSDGSLADITTSVTWSSSAPAVASVSGVAGSIGVVTGNAVGSATVTASLNGQSSTVTVQVTSAVLQAIQLPATTQIVPRGLTLPIVATGIYSDGSIAQLTSSVTWSSSAPGIASVSNLVANAGLVTGIAEGTTTVTATLGTTSSTVTVQVTAAVLQGISLPAQTVTVATGLSVPVIATGLYSDGSQADLTKQVTWSSSAPAIATVSNLVSSIGVVTGVAAGDATLTASYNGQTATVPVHVTAAILQAIQLPAQPITVARGLTVPVIATGVYSDGSIADITTNVTWTSSASAIASVSNLAGSVGLVTGVAVGDATLTAAYNGQASQIAVHVTSAVLQSLQLPASTVNVPKGLTVPVTALGAYSDGSLIDLTTAVTWSSSAPAIASVSNVVGSVGLVTGVATGDAVLTASYGGKSTTVPVHVSAAVLQSISLPTGPILVSKGLASPIIATGHYSDGSLATLTTNVIWSSSAPTIATVSNLVATAGIVSGVQTGFATITATLGTVSQTIQVQVTPAILQGITVNAPAALGLLQVGAVTATGTYSDGTTADLTSQVQFTSSNPLAATVSATGGLLGLAVGNTTITAKLGSVQGVATIGVGSDGCHLVINEVKAGTLLASKDDFVEIYNACSYAVDMSQLNLVYRDTLSVSDTVLVSLSGSIVAGQYRIYVGTQFSSGGTIDGTFTTDIGGLLGGAVGLRITSSGTLVDSVAWGVTINGLGEGAVLGAITLGSTLARIPNGRDTNWNLADFALLTTSTPRAAN